MKTERRCIRVASDVGLSPLDSRPLLPFFASTAALLPCSACPTSEIRIWDRYCALDKDGRFRCFVWPSLWSSWANTGVASGAGAGPTSTGFGFLFRLRLRGRLRFISATPRSWGWALLPPFPGSAAPRSPCKGCVFFSARTLPHVVVWVTMVDFGSSGVCPTPSGDSPSSSLLANFSNTNPASSRSSCSLSSLSSFSFVLSCLCFRPALCVFFGFFWVASAVSPSGAEHARNGCSQLQHVNQHMSPCPCLERRDR